jgi:(2Fe-2S) ferredoxin
MPIKPEYHVLVCTNERPTNVPGGSCGARGGKEIYSEFLDLIQENNLGPRILVSSIQCAGPCSLGPIVIIYPDGIWYCKVCSQHGVKQIFEEHLLGGNVVENLLLPDWAWPDLPVCSGKCKGERI